MNSGSAGVGPQSAGPAAALFTLPVEWQAVDFLSDLHLSEATPATALALLEHLRHTPAQAVFVLGDLFELWVGDDMLTLPFERDFTAALRAAKGARALRVMHGNRDFLLGAEFAKAAGAQMLPDPLLLAGFGTRLLATHGDALCLADEPYQTFRAQVRQPAWQAAFLARSLAERLAHARAIRHASENRKLSAAPETWADVDGAAACRCLAASACKVMIHGHTHRPGNTALTGGAMRQVLSDWDLDSPNALERRGDVIRWSAAGLQRLAVGHASA